MPGICTSNIKHRVSDTNDERRNDSADANVWAANPIDLTRASRAPRIQSSSSTMDMSGVSVKRSFHHRYAPRRRYFEKGVDNGATGGLSGK
jgi:hypothetical protein